MEKKKKGWRAVISAIATFILLSATFMVIYGGIGFVAFHFIRKYW